MVHPIRGSQESGDCVLVWNKTRKIFYFYGHEITADEYQRILSIIANRPTAPEGYGYRLTAGLEWELYELPTEETLEA